MVSRAITISGMVAIAKPRPLLLERDAELAWLSALLEKAQAGSGGVAVISGPPGIGKTELLLQTEAYATAVHRAQLMNADEGEISKQVAVRMARQHRLTEPDAPQLWVVLNEAVIRRLVGDRGVMQAQLVKLSELSGAPNVVIQVLPFSAGAHPAMDSAFSVVTFDPPTPGDVVYFEYPSGALYLELPDDVARYRLMFDHLRAMALSPEDSRRLLARSAEDLA